MLQIEVSHRFLENLEAQLPAELLSTLESIVADLANKRDVNKKPLGRVRAIGNLTNCWTVKFDLPGFHNRYRLVFELVPDAVSPTILRLHSVGPRFEYPVYRDAVASLNEH